MAVTSFLCTGPAVALLALCLALYCTGAQAWSPAGHERIAKIADILLKRKKHELKVNKLLKGSLMEFAEWEQQMTKEHPKTDVLHWHSQDPEWTCHAAQTSLSHVGSGGHVRCDGRSADKGSLFCAMAYFFEHFAHDALLREYPKPSLPLGETPEKLAALDSITSLELEPHHYLRWLAILIGDLHQPLHWLREHDYGSAVKLVYQGEEYSLLKFWEDYIPKHLPSIPGKQQLETEYDMRSHLWHDKIPTELFHDWAEEVADVVCGQVYAVMEKRHEDGSIELEDRFNLPEEVFQRWVKLAHDFTTLSGERLAFVLLDIIEHRQHAAAHKEGRGKRHKKRNWFANFGINVGIAMVGVPLLLGFFVMHADGRFPGMPSAARKDDK